MLSVAGQCSYFDSAFCSSLLAFYDLCIFHLCAFGAMTLLVRCQEGHPACETSSDTQTRALELGLTYSAWKIGRVNPHVYMPVFF